MNNYTSALLRLGLISCGLVGFASGGVITSGTIEVVGINTSGSFSVAGAGFSVQGNSSLGNWSPAFCSPCSSNSLLSVNGIVVGNDFGPGSATIGSTVFPNVLWGDLNAVGSTFFQVTGPSLQLTPGGGAYTGTFTFTGSMCGTAPGYGSVKPCIVDLPTLTGSGVVMVYLGAYNSPGPVLQFTRAVYTFTPEPSMLIPTSLGLLALCFARARARVSGN